MCYLLKLSNFDLFQNIFRSDFVYSVFILNGWSCPWQIVKWLGVCCIPGWTICNAVGGSVLLLFHPLLVM